MQRSFADTAKGKKIIESKKNQENQKENSKTINKTLSKSQTVTSSQEPTEESSSNKPADNVLSTEQRTAFLSKKFGKSKTKTPDVGQQSPEQSSSPKKKMAQHTFTDKVTKKDMEKLDVSLKYNKDCSQNANIENKLNEYMDSSKSDTSNSDFESSDEDIPSKSSGQQTKKSGFLSKLTSKIQNYTGNKVINEDDILPILNQFKDELMSKNVAEPIAQTLVNSLKSTLIDKKTEAFTSLGKTVKEALRNSLTKILTPKRSFDLIAEALKCKEQGKPYVITFIGVNGVGKSTNLAKVAYLFKTKGFSVMLAACDNFRAGAVEQLKTHGRCLDIPVYDRGYKDDPADIAALAIRQAILNKNDIVLIDTAGRMQNNEPLMKSLSKLIVTNKPNLVIFIGEALVGNDGVDQLTSFNRALIDLSPKDQMREIDGIILSKFDTVDDKVGAAISLTYATGKPILFIGTGQKYTNLKKLHVKTVVTSLLN